MAEVGEEPGNEATQGNVATNLILFPGGKLQRKIMRERERREIKRKRKREEGGREKERNSDLRERLLLE